MGDLRLYNEREDFCEDFISMVFQILLVIVYYIYVGGYQATHFVSLFAAQAAQAYQWCIESNSTICISS